MAEMIVDSIRVSLVNYQRVVILKEKFADRYLPIWIGPAEADAIALRLQEVAVPRPLTHDLLGSVIVALGAKVDSIIVNDLANDTFYAKIILKTDGSQMEIDSRPSDAIALAVRAKVPIYAEEQVLKKAGIILDRETGKPKPSVELSDEELKKLSVFKEALDNIDWEGFEKREKE
ncbi:MAG: bifunctional nuclease family protein [Chloroflexota bacterium]